MLRDVLATTPTRTGTRLGEAVKFLLRTAHRRALVFWLSDFEDRLEVHDWRLLGRRHEVTCLLLRDARDEVLPNVGWIELEDLESGKRALVDTGNARVRAAYQKDALARRAAAEQVLTTARCSLVELHLERPWMPVLMRYFAARRRRGPGRAA
jgi:hypothetical protein